MATCIDVSTDLFFCKTVDGLAVGRDWQVGKDPFDKTKWTKHFGIDLADWTHDTVNGYIQPLSGGSGPFGANGGIIFTDVNVSELITPWIAVESWYLDRLNFLSGVTALTSASHLGDYVEWIQAWIIVPTDNRFRIGSVVNFVASLLLPRATGINNDWQWINCYAEPAGSNTRVLGSANDSGWVDQVLAGAPEILNSTGLGGLYSFKPGGLGTDSTKKEPVRYRKFRIYKSGTITILNVPDNHEIRLIRDAGEFTAKTITHQNTSGGSLDIVSDAIGFPTPPNNNKINAPLTRIEMYVIGGAKVAEFTPIPSANANFDVDGINWGDVYDFSVIGGGPPGVGTPPTGTGGFSPLTVCPTPAAGGPVGTITVNPPLVGFPLTVDCENGSIPVITVDCENGTVPVTTGDSSTLVSPLASPGSTGICIVP